VKSISRRRKDTAKSFRIQLITCLFLLLFAYAWSAEAQKSLSVQVREGQFAQAEAIFTGLKDRDRAALSYADKCRSLMAHPPEDWDGVWIVTTQ
jgi:hypothetical protein